MMFAVLEGLLQSLCGESQGSRKKSLRVLAATAKYASGFEPQISHRILEELMRWLKSPECKETELVIVVLTDILQREDAWELMTDSKVLEIEELLSTIEGTNKEGEIVDEIRKLRSVILLQNRSRNVNPDGERCSVLLRECFPIRYLAWVTLVKADSNVIRSLEYAWGQENNEAQLLQLCRLTREVILKDFPSEILLQKTYILKEIFCTLDQTISSKIRDAILHLLEVITANMIIRIAESTNPRFITLKFEGNLITTDENAPSGTIYQQYRNTYPNFAGDYDPRIVRNLTQVLNGSDEINFFVHDNSEIEKEKQMTVPHYCIECMERAIKFDHMKLAEGLLTLWHSLHITDIWRCTDPGAAIIRVSLAKLFNTLCISLKNKRSCYEEVSDCQENKIISSRRQYLFHLAFTVAMMKSTIPVGQECSIISDQIQNTLMQSIHDYTLITMFSDIFLSLIQYRSVFNSVQKEKWRNLDIFVNVLKGMEYSMKLVKSKEETLSRKILTPIMMCIQSLEITHFYPIIKWFIKISINSHSRIMEDEEIRKQVREIILQLISHSDREIQKEVFRISCDELKTILCSEDSDKNLDKASAFLDAEIISAVIHKGFADESTSKLALEIVVRFVRKWQCRIGCQTETVLDKLLPVFPYLQCIMDMDPSLAIHLLDILDPVKIGYNTMPWIEVLKGNIRALFITKEKYIKQLCVSRILYIVTSALQESCDPSSVSFENVLEAFRTRQAVNLTHFQHLQLEVDIRLVDSMLGILESDEQHEDSCEMALKHLALLLRDWRHHDAFQSRGGLSILSNVLERALIKKTIRKELAIPVVDLLKLLCVQSLSARIKLSSQEKIICYIIIAMVRFGRHETLCQDARIVLGLLVFQNMLRINIPVRGGIQNRCSVSLPERVLKLLALPFICTAHEYHCPTTVNPVPDAIKISELCNVSLRQCWAVNFFGINSLVKMTYSWYESLYQGPQHLKLTPLDLTLLRASFVQGMYKTLIFDLQNACNHTVVKESIHILHEYMSLEALDCENFQGNMPVWQSLPWEEKLKIFFSVKPTNDADIQLLFFMVKFINSTICRQVTGDVLKPIKWLVSILKSPDAPLTSLLKIDVETEFELWGEIVNLVTLVCSAQSDVENKGNESSSWCFIINSMLDNIEIVTSSEVTDLGLLYTILQCLSAITSINGWSYGFPNISQLCDRFVTLIQNLLWDFVWQRMPKGFKASFICSYITKNAAICLKNIIRELWNDKSSLGALTTLNVTSVTVLTECRDVVVRSSGFEALAILCNCSPGRDALTEKFGGTFCPLLAVAHRVLLDRYETDTVRCGAAQLILNVLRNLLEQGRQQVYPPYEQFITLLRSADFYKKLHRMAEQLCYAEVVFWDYEKDCLDMDTTKKYSNTFSVEGIPPKCLSEPTSSPTLLRYMCVIVKLLIMWDCDKIPEHFEEKDLIFALFRCLQVIPCDSHALYMHTLEMCIEICNLLSLYLQERVDFISTTSGFNCCMEGIGFLLEPFVYNNDSTQAFRLRNKLWCALFGLITSIMRNHDGFHMFMDVISRSKYHGNFYTTVELAMNSKSPQVVRKALNILSDYLKPISSSIPKESSTVSNEQETIKCRDCPKDTQSDLFNMGVLRLKNASVPLTKVLCRKTQKIFPMKFNVTRISYVYKCELLVCITNLCAISEEAVKLCIDYNLTETAVMEITHIHKFLRGRTSVDTWSSKRAIKGLKLILSLLGNLLKQPEAKERASRNGFAQQIAVTWPLLSSFSELRNLILKAVCNFSANYQEGLESLLETGPTPCVNVLQSTFSLLLDEMEEVTKSMPEYDSSCTYYASKILGNAMHSPRCRVFIQRCIRKLDLAILITFVGKCRKAGIKLLKNLLEFLSKFTFYAEGQQAFLQVPKIIELLKILLQIPDRQVKELSLIVISNLTAIEKIKLAIMDDEILTVFRNIMKRGSVDMKFTLVKILKNLIVNSARRKHILRDYNFPKYIDEFVISFDSNAEDQETIDRLKVIDEILKMF